MVITPIWTSEKKKGKDNVYVVEIDDAEGEYNDFSSDSSWLHNMVSDNKDDIDIDSMSLVGSKNTDMSFSDFDDNEKGDVVPDSKSEKECDPIQQALK